ncbi:MAG: methylated-DNA--[protein]-cysteine S-methyltransferase [Chloroflexi bacterium]|nr:methylated-DNA--[protein]-cysteine S-methyltransferase [Chloroflexota bacterium]
MNAHQSAAATTSLKYDVFETSLGWVGVIASERGLRRTTLPEPTVETAMSALGPDLAEATHDPDYVARFRDQVRRFLAGEHMDLTGAVPDPISTAPFFLKAWDACRSIPPGETRTYGWLAGAAGNPRAVRAAGQAMARNPLPLVIPCHRVVGSDGGLHGFGGSIGLTMKQKLLELERKSASGAA